MPDQPKNKHRSVRFSDEDWEDLRRATEGIGSDRGTVLKEFVAWYLHHPGSKAVKRPDVDKWRAAASDPSP